MSRLTVTEYAALSVRLAHVSATPGVTSVESVLREARLTSEEWDAETLHWEEQLSLALDREDDMPHLVLEYSTAIQAAQEALAGGPLSLETFSHVLGDVQRGAALDQVLRQHHTTLPEFLSAQRHWMERAISDPEVRLALEAALR